MVGVEFLFVDLFYVFKVVLIMLLFHFQGTPYGARHISFPVLFAPLFLLQGAGILCAAYRLVEKILLLAHTGVDSVTYSALVSKACDFFGFLQHGSRCNGLHSIDLIL